MGLSLVMPSVLRRRERPYSSLHHRRHSDHQRISSCPIPRLDFFSLPGKSTFPEELPVLRTCFQSFWNTDSSSKLFQLRISISRFTKTPEFKIGYYVFCFSLMSLPSVKFLSHFHFTLLLLVRSLDLFWYA